MGGRHGREQQRIDTIMEIVSGFQGITLINNTEAGCIAWANDMAIELREIGKLASFALQCIDAGGSVAAARFQIERDEERRISLATINLIRDSTSLKKMLHEHDDKTFIANMHKLLNAFPALPDEKFDW